MLGTTPVSCRTWAGRGSLGPCRLLPSFPLAVLVYGTGGCFTEQFPDSEAGCLEGFGWSRSSSALCLFISGKRKRLKEMQGSDIAHGCMTHPCLVQAALCPWHRWGATGAGGDCHGLICTAQCESHWEEECHPPSPCPFTVVLGTEGRCWMWMRSPKWGSLKARD